MADSLQHKYQELLEGFLVKLKQEEHFTQQALEAWLKEANTYLEAAEELTEDELILMKKYIRRDIHAFVEQMGIQVRQNEESVWLATLKETLWHHMSEVSDKTQLEWHELAQDLTQEGCYQA